MKLVHYQAPNALGAPVDILLRWKVNSLKYPIVSQIAIDALAILIFTVASKFALSIRVYILYEYRSSIIPNMVEALILA